MKNLHDFTDKWAHKKADELRALLPEKYGYGLIVFAFESGQEGPVHIISDACCLDVIGMLRAMADDLEAEGRV